jgi:two-component system, LuxR family, response regulator FixJ
MGRQGASSTSNLVIAVIDDDSAVRNSLKFLLELEGLVVRIYTNGAELMGAGDLARCDCLVVDQNMPEPKGLDLIALLRAREFNAPAILITSHPSASLRDRAAKARVPIVEKPLLGNALLDKIRDLTANDGS